MKPNAWLIALATASLTSCASVGPGATDSFCDVAKPIWFDPADRMTRQTERAIIAHNEKGARLCAWGK